MDRPDPIPGGKSEAEHLRLVLEHGGIGAWELDTRTGRAWRNARHDQIFGYDEPLDDWTYDRFLEHVARADREEVDARYGAALREGHPWSFECRIHRADGAERWIGATGKPLRDEAGEVARLIGHVIDITHIKRREEELRTITQELNHRVRNTLSIVQSIASQSFPPDRSVEEGQREFVGRIGALAEAHSLLTDEGWRGAGMEEVIRAALTPYRGAALPACTVEGPPVRLEASQAVNVAMLINELATNAVKHGALSVPEGRLTVRWAVEEEGDGAARCRLDWTERGGPPASAPSRKGFGTRLISNVLRRDDGEARTRYAPEGFSATLAFRLKGRPA